MASLRKRDTKLARKPILRTSQGEWFYPFAFFIACSAKKEAKYLLEPVLKSKRLFPSAVDLAIHCEPHWGVAVDSPKPSGLKTKSLSLI